ncbi:Phage protein [Vibrio crassostreae]|jgi:hypothetical protein|nr:Phage protein [Vibrio crassostreae]CAK2099931.1 Phage protein [Vibrio crassostreae]CAK2372129.1 Phage protein [Vibrio crassostreae]CAK2912065.1 Phage protein [Vibrio crassostreae]CAK2986794.1 Phage protein [Vibrio crassostreae]
MKNKLLDLNNHLFAQLERLSDEGLKGDELKEEINRSKAVTGVSKEIVSNARLALDAQMAIGQSLKEGQLPAMIEEKQ